MVIVDSSVWIEHLKQSNSKLIALLEEDAVLTHPFIIGELACGTPRKREEFIMLIQLLPRAKDASFEEVLSFIEQNNLYGKGVGWIDVHLLASSLLSQAKLWTFDKRLAKLAKTGSIAVSFI